MFDPTFKPKSLEEVFSRSNKPQQPVEWRGAPGEPKPLWAILKSDPPYGWDAGNNDLSATGGGVHSARNNGADAGGPESCSDHYAPGSVVEGICKSFGDGDWANCVRRCLYKVVPDEWKDDIDYWDEDTLKWAAAHFGCWTSCPEDG